MQFLVVPLGLEGAAAQELEEVSIELQNLLGSQFALKKTVVLKGGVEFESDSQLGWLGNSLLKIPSRILQRWLEFKVRDFPSLYKKLKKAEWQKSLFKNGIGKIHVAASSSRLNNEKRILKLLNEVLTELKISTEKSNAPDLYFRMHDDVAMLSVDTSGEHLHFRNYRKQQGEAPLRENFAAFTWRFLIENLGASQLADFNLVDPMMGSGTLLFEALLWDKQIQGRNFVASNWLDDSTKNKVQNFYRGKPFQVSIWGFDHAEELVSKARQNFRDICKNYKNEEGINSYFEKVDLLLAQKNSFPPELFQKKRILISNPPYGERIQSQESCLTYCEKALNLYEPELAVFLVPDRKETREKKQFSNYKKISEVPFLNNGIRVIAQKWEIHKAF
jgi:23S rRNA G2445 N2-methylase RlmL